MWQKVLKVAFWLFNQPFFFPLFIILTLFSIFVLFVYSFKLPQTHLRKSLERLFHINNQCLPESEFSHEFKETIFSVDPAAIPGCHIKSSFEAHIFSLSFTHKVKTISRKVNINTPDSVDLSNSNDFMSKPILVMGHGFGFGIGCFYKNINHLMKDFSKVIIFDWAGCGLSSRIPFRPRNSEESEQFFVYTFTQWAKSMKLDKTPFVLLGHSFGGYMSACIALKHTLPIQHLVLVSPVGVPPDPAQPRFRVRSYFIRFLFMMIRCLFLLGATPQKATKLLGRYGQKFVTFYVRRRFHQQDVQLLEQYFLGLWYSPLQSFEIAVHKVLTPRIFGKDPLVHRLSASKLKIPTTFLYGKFDWMNSSPAFTIKESRSEHDLFTHVETIEDAGHHLYMDNPDSFSKELSRVSKQVVVSNPIPSNIHQNWVKRETCEVPIEPRIVVTSPASSSSSSSSFDESAVIISLESS